jgi:hypothetical protein
VPLSQAQWKNHRLQPNVHKIIEKFWASTILFSIVLLSCDLSEDCKDADASADPDGAGGVIKVSIKNRWFALSFTSVS